MDLFNRKLTISEAQHYNSILDNGSVDTDVLLLHRAMKTKPWQPNMRNPTAALSKAYHIAQQVAKEPNPTNQIQLISAKKNPSRKYIKLPNATIKQHQHKYRKRKNEPTDEQQSD